MGWLSSSREAARIVSDCRIMVSSTRCATLGGLLLITQGSAPPVTRAAYSFVRGVYVLQSTKEASELLRTPCMRTSMRRHCLSRPTWRSLCGERNYSVLRAMLLFALVVSLLSSDSVHRMRSVFSGSTKVLLSSERSFLLEGWTKFAWRSHLMLDPKRIRAREAVLSLPSGSSRFRSSPPL